MIGRKILMAYMISSIDEAVDGKYLVVKDRKNQAKCGTLVHIMSSRDNGNGTYTVGYRVTGTGQDFSDTFDGLKEFCDWVKPDSFIARYYECFEISEVSKYIKINQRTFLNFCLPIMVIALVVIWIIFGAVVKGTAGVVLGIILSVAAIGGTIFFYKHSKSKIKLDLYKKIGSARWGVNFK